jgi:hypothetical protein
VAGTASSWTITYETASGDTENATQTLLPLHWERATWTLRRRAPHAFTITVPVYSHHLPSAFFPRRELRLLRDGVYVAWGAGFMGAPQLTPAGEDDWGPIELPGYGNVLCLDFDFAGFTAQAFDADALLGVLLNAAEHGSGGDWFASGQRTIGTASIAVDDYSTQGKAALDCINEMVDLEGWAWRAGINSSGAFTFTANGTIDTDRASSIHLIDGANCRITGVVPDDSRLANSTLIYSHYPAYRSQLNGAHLAGVTSITVDSTLGLESGDIVHFSPGGTAYESRVVNLVSSGTVFTLVAGLLGNQADNAVVQLPTELYRGPSASAGSANSRQAHHSLVTIIYDDTMASTDLRDQMAQVYQDVYDGMLRTATVETTDPALIATMLDAGLEPGDSVGLTSYHRYLSAWYTGETVKVHEMAIELEPGGCRKITLQVGDQRLDDLAVLERMVKAGQRAATAKRSPG